MTRFLSALLSNSRLGYGLEQLRANDGISLRRLPFVLAIMGGLFWVFTYLMLGAEAWG